MNCFRDIVVPSKNSLQDDAPGYYSLSDINKDTESLTLNSGPICWKCKGTGNVKVKKDQDLILCKVCKGNKRINVKSNFLKGTESPGQITRQSIPMGWKAFGPKCVGLDEYYLSSLDQDQLFLLSPNIGEQLCVLVGEWRIFQRFSGHRWTTDDLVTAWAAGRSYKNYNSIIDANNSASSNQPLNILDLGCGNGSVLLMTAWQFPTANCIGIEARKDALLLAKKSIYFNCGLGNDRITTRNNDIRDIYNLDESIKNSVLPEGSIFDLITGTPPYFKVDFNISSDDLIVKEAIIQQGGMPTCKESAPARCEYRGGIEVYCKAASSALSKRGLFVVCENWLNHKRVLLSSQDNNLVITEVIKVYGKEGKPPLFCVYTMRHKTNRDNYDYNSSNNDDDSIEIKWIDLVVRDKDGNRTLQYKNLLANMSYPIA